MGIFTGRFAPGWVGLFVLIADAASKYWTNAYLPIMRFYSLWYPYGGIGVFKDFLGIEFSISHQTNHGAAWGIFADHELPLLYLRIALVICLCGYAVFFNKHSSWNIPMALIVAGATGNIIDYFIYGHVVDMLHFVLWGYDFPVFNIADSAIFIGVFSLMALSCFEKKSS
ncbi:MAG: signal peptidase II [Parachlamydiaceae bacterium]